MYQKNLLFLLLFTFCTGIGQNFWSPLKDQINTKYSLDQKALIQSMAHHQLIDLPIPGLEGIWIQMEERSNFSDELAAKYPRIKSYQSINISSIVYIDTDGEQVHIFYITDHETYFIEPIHQDTNEYTLLLASQLKLKSTNAQSFACKTEEPNPNHSIEFTSGYRDKKADKISLKTYRLALAVTAEFAATLGNTKEKILAGLNSHLTRINAVYRNENAIEFKLVPNNDTLIFMDSNQPYTNGQLDKMIVENPIVLNARIGLNNYDIGHVFGTNAGGLAQLAVVCTASKGAGASCSFGTYRDVLFYTIPCHEIGHQFNATHIFNFCDNSNETSSSAFEPGSGSTIMSYAGASNCGKNYVQDIQDPYFNAFSLQQIKSYSKAGTGNACGTSSLTDNESPQIKIISPADVMIPISTPFELEGTGTDDRTKDILYTWEEMDLGQISALGSPSGTAPLFRSLSPGISTIRTFPSIKDILNNTSQITEVLPIITRPLNFRFSARDIDPSAGGVAWTDISFKSTVSAGPFKITTLNDTTTLYKNDVQYITWNVSNTSGSPVNCKSVDILWTEDDGLSYSTLLKSTPNDGSEWIIIPNHSTNTGRIKIKAVGNLFFDFNNAYLKVKDQINPSLKIYTSPDQLQICAGNETKVVIKSSNSSSKDTLQLISNVSNDLGITVLFSKNNLTKDDSSSMTIKIKSLSIPEDRIIKVSGINKRSGDTISLNIQIRISSDNVNLIQPTNNQSQVTTTPVFKWQSIPHTEDYIIEISTSATFQFVVWSKKLLAGDVSAIADSTLKSNEIYYWRIRSINGCIGNNSNFAVFHTQALTCKTYIPQDLPKFISATGTPRISSEIIVSDSLGINLITLPFIRGTHDFIADLTMTLYAPSGDSIILWSKQCNNLSNFNLGLDDQAPISLSCPLTDRKIHRPQQLLSLLNASKSKGSWRLNVSDGNNGAGGSLDEWSLQLCGAITGQGPVFKTNKIIEILELKSKNITSESIEVIDQDSDAGKLKFVLLQNPQFGNLVVNGAIQSIGSTFTQADINAGKLSFNASSVTMDTIEEISFLVVDESNNWSGIQKMRVKVLNDLTIAVKNETIGKLIKVYPNPFSNHLTIENDASIKMHANLFTMDGKLIQSTILYAHQSTEVKWQLPSGIYALICSSQTGETTTLKIVSY